MSIFRELGIEEAKGRAGEQVLYNIAACYALAERRIAGLLAGFGLTPVQLNALMIIRHVGGAEGLTQSELCHKLIVTAGNVTRLIDRLEQARWVRRVSQPGDRRVNRLRTTPEGERLLEKAWPPYLKQVQELMAGFSAKHLEQTAGHLERLRRHFQAQKHTFPKGGHA